MDSGPLPLNGKTLRELQPSFAVEFNRNAVSGYGIPSQDSLLRDYLRVLIKSKWVVITTVLLFVSVVTISTLRTTPIYEAVGSIAINKMDPVTFNLKDSSSSVEHSDPADINQEVRIPRSDLLALQVIRDFNLDKQPVEAGSKYPSSPLGSTTDAINPDSERTTAVLASVL